jgi:hypothetical protein
MKQFYTVALLFIVTSFLPNDILAQCVGVNVENISNPGPYQVATLTEANGIRNGSEYKESTIYYPINATAPFASIAIVPGFNSGPETLVEWGPFYASHGIVAIIIGTNSRFSLPDARATALIDALETLRQENSRVGSPLKDKLDTNKFGVSGWSMGGGGAQRAAVSDNRIKGVIALCPWLASNSSLNHSSPVLIFSGQNDRTAQPAQHADLQYNATPNTTNKLLFEVANGGHDAANSPNRSNGMIGKIALSWFKLYVEKNDCYCSLKTSSLLINSMVASKIVSNFECNLPNGGNPPGNGSDETNPNILKLANGGQIIIKSNASINLKGLKLTPNTDYTLVANNTVTRSLNALGSAPNESMARVFNFELASSSFTGKIIYYYDDVDLGTITHSDAVLQVKNDADIWMSYADEDSSNNKITYTFNSPITFKSVTASASATTLSIDSLTEEIKIAIYPNPVNTILHIQYHGELKTTIYDFLGRKLMDSQLKTIDMSKMPNGMYIIHTTDTTTNKKNSYKIIKK